MAKPRPPPPLASPRATPHVLSPRALPHGARAWRSAAERAADPLLAQRQRPASPRPMSARAFRSGRPPTPRIDNRKPSGQLPQLPKTIAIAVPKIHQLDKLGSPCTPHFVLDRPPSAPARDGGTVGPQWSNFHFAAAEPPKPRPPHHPVALTWSADQLAQSFRSLGEDFVPIADAMRRSQIDGTHLARMNASTLPALGVNSFHHVKAVMCHVRALLAPPEPEPEPAVPAFTRAPFTRAPAGAQAQRMEALAATAEEVAAATRLQSATRGQQGRKPYAQMRKEAMQRKDAEQKKALEQRKAIDVQREAEAAAAVKLQSIQRGRLARQQIMRAQLVEILHTNQIELIDLFREWDHDRNGGIDKKEMRRGLAALGYGFPKKEVDALFDSINEAGDGFIDFEDLKRALSGESGHAVARGR
jgi:hypothetical protein